MRNKMLIIFGVVIILFGALYFANNYKTKQAIENNGNPYGKEDLRQETIDQLNNPLYQDQITPGDLAKRLDNKEDVTIYFYSPTCGYCVKTTPVLVPVAEELDVEVKKMNLLEYKEEWDIYGMEGTPTLIHYKNGEEFARITGQQTAESFENFFNENVLTEK